jgi:hypothetical protein
MVLPFTRPGEGVAPFVSARPSGFHMLIHRQWQRQDAATVSSAKPLHLSFFLSPASVVYPTEARS